MLQEAKRNAHEKARMTIEEEERKKWEEVLAAERGIAEKEGRKRTREREDKRKEEKKGRLRKNQEEKFRQKIKQEMEKKNREELEHVEHTQEEARGGRAGEGDRERGGERGEEATGCGR